MIWTLAPILIPLTSALLAMAARGHPHMVRAIGVTGAILLCGAGFGLLWAVENQGVIVLQAGNWPAPVGISLVADLLSALMVTITGIISLAVAIYSLRDVNRNLLKSHYFALFHFLLLGVNGAFLTGDLFNLFVWFEVMLLSSFVLITMEGKRQQLEGGVKYLVINLVASALFLSGIGILYGKLGTLNMADIALRLANTPDAFLINSSSILLLVAFAIKAGMFPFFFWLPASYHTPQVAISALFAGLLTKVGVYALIRSYTLLFNSQFAVMQDVLIVLAGATMITGVFGAATQFEIRKILSFHIVSQIGYMIMGLAIGSALALAAAVFYILHHIIVKTNLFLVGGLIMRKCGTSDLARTGGLYKWAPGLALLFFIPAFSLGGIPPLSGFWAKFSVIQAGLEAEHYALVAAALLVGVLTLYSMIKIWAEAFLKAKPMDSRAPAENAPGPNLHWTLVVPCVILALLTVWIGLAGAPLLNLALATSEQLLNPEIYIEAVLNPPIAHYEK